MSNPPSTQCPPQRGWTGPGSPPAPANGSPRPGWYRTTYGSTSGCCHGRGERVRAGQTVSPSRRRPSPGEEFLEQFVENPPGHADPRVVNAVGQPQPAVVQQTAAGVDDV